MASRSLYLRSNSLINSSIAERPSITSEGTIPSLVSATATTFGTLGPRRVDVEGEELGLGLVVECRVFLFGFDLCFRLRCCVGDTLIVCATAEVSE